MNVKYLCNKDSCINIKKDFPYSSQVKSLRGLFVLGTIVQHLSVVSLALCLKVFIKAEKSIIKMKASKN